MLTIFIIGTGNLGTQLCKTIESPAVSQKKAVFLSGYYNRSQVSLNQINAPLQANFSLAKTVDLVLLCVPDSDIEMVANALPETSAVIAHCSGSISMNSLEITKNYGVFYLPQTFSKDRDIPLDNIPICLESSSKAVMEILEIVAVTLSRKRNYLDSNQRKSLHLAAVYINNFVNHCYLQAADILQESQLSPELLEPLMQETLEKAKELGSKNAQTGPAKRGDQVTIEAHLKLLPDSKKELYQAITNSILKTYRDEL